MENQPSDLVWAITRKFHSIYDKEHIYRSHTQHTTAAIPMSFNYINPEESRNQFNVKFWTNHHRNMY